MTSGSDWSKGVSTALLKGKGHKLNRVNAKSGQARSISIAGYLLKAAGIDPNKELCGSWESELGEERRSGAKKLILWVWEVPDGDGAAAPSGDGGRPGTGEGSSVAENEVLQRTSL